MSKKKIAGIIVGCIIAIIVIVAIATSTPTYILSVSVYPPEAGSVSPSGGEYESGLQITLTATPASGYTFDYWAIAASGSSNTVTITMNSDKTISAHFKVVEPSPTPTQFKTYSKYGFSFEYPKTFSITEMGIQESEANDTSGLVQAWVENNEEFELFQVCWMKTMPGMMELEPGLEGNLKDSLEDGFQYFETIEGVVLDRGEFVVALQMEHLMVYQYYTATFTEGDKVYGVLSCFYCDSILKLFSLMTINNTIDGEEEALEDFQNYLGTLRCH